MVIVKPDDGESQIKEAVAQFKTILSRPIKQVADFYTYYYLTEIQAEDQFNFNHFRTTTRLQDSLYNYSIYAASGEVTNAARMLLFDDKKIGWIRRNGGSIKADLTEYVEQNAKQPNLVRELLVGTNSINKKRDAIEPLDLARKVEQKYKAYSNSKEYLQALSFIFGHFGLAKTRTQSSTTGEMNTQERLVARYGWENNYGGPPWASVCETALQYHEMGKTAFVDLILSVEHNNGNFLDKLPMKNEEAGEMLRSALEDVETPEEQLIVDNVFNTSKTVRQKTYDLIIPTLLDMAREEEMLTILKITATHDNNVSAWLRKNKDTL